MDGGVSKTYVDTSYFVTAALNEENADEVRRMFFRLKNNAFRVVVPQLVLGETVAKILEKRSGYHERSDCLGRLHGMFSEYAIDVRSCLPNVSVKTCEIIPDIHANDDRITANDAMILAQVLADPESKFFITADRVLLDGEWITRYEQSLHGKYRRVRLKITDSV